MCRVGTAIGLLLAAVVTSGCYVYIDENLWRHADASHHDARPDTPTVARADAAVDARRDVLGPDLRSTDLASQCKIPADCDDQLSCTTHACTAGACVHTLVAGYCLIGASCVANGTSSPSNPCLACATSVDAHKWTDHDGASCDDGVACTHTDTCSKGSCAGTPYICSDGLSCTTDTCTGTGPAPGGCSFKVSSGCVIAGVCQAPGALNSSKPCEQCSPTSSTTSWTPFGKCVSTLAGTGSAGFANGPAAGAKFSDPYGVAVDASGQVFVADEQNHRLRLISGGLVSTVAGSGTAGFGDGPTSVAMFNGLRGVALGGGVIYVGDTSNHRVRMIAAGQVTTVAGSALGFLDGPVATALFSQPKGMCVDSAGAIYVADYGNHRVRMIVGGQVSTVAGTGVAGATEGPVSIAKLWSPRDVAVDGSGNVYIADSGNNKIRVVANGKVSTLAGAGAASFADGPALAALFATPYGIAVDATGKIYVADMGNNRVRLISGGQVTTLAGSGQTGYVNGPAALARFNQPNGVAVDASGKVYIADHLNAVVRLYTP